MNTFIPLGQALSRLGRWVLLLIVAGLLSLPARAGSGPDSKSTTPSLSEVLNPDGTLRAGASGSFNPKGFRMATAPDGRPVFKAAGITGAGDEKWQDGFGLPGVNGTVNAVATNGTDVYVGGNFSITAAGAVVAKYIARWDGTSWSSLGSGTSGNVHALALSGSTLYVGGSFAQAGGITVNSLARWNGTAWSSMGGANSTVYALALSGADLYVGGRFSAVGGVSANRIARWNGTSWSALGSGVNDDVLALAVSGSVVYAGGYFTTAGAVNASRVARWSGTAWSAMGAGVNGTVHALAISGSTVFVGGSFSTAGAVTANNIARWTGGTTWVSLGTGVNSTVQALSLIGTDLYVGGSFFQAGGLTANNVARWSGTAWNAMGTGVNERVNALAASGTELYTGGSFTAAGGVGAARIAKWNGSAWSRFGSGFTAAIYAVATHGADVYVGGEFTTAGNVTASRVAKWNGSTWSSLGTGVNNNVFALTVDSNGILYAGGDFTQAGGVAVNHIAKWNGTAWSSLGTGTNFSVRALLAQGTEVYAGGQFNEAGGVNTGSVAKWNGTAWSALGTGVNGQVFALAMNGTSLYVGGQFMLAANTVQVARWNGTSWSALGNTLQGTADALAVAPNGTVYAAGFNIGITGTYVRNLVKWNGSTWSGVGGMWTQLASGGAQSHWVSTLAIVGPALYVGGNFKVSEGGPGNYVAKWDGTNWTNLGTGLNGVVSALAGSGGNVLHAGGSFTMVGDESKVTAHYGQYDATSNALTGINPMSGPVGQTVTINGWDLSGATAVSFNGTNAPGFTVSADGHSITVNVPTGATNGPITISLPGGPLTSSGSFILMSTGTTATFGFTGTFPDFIGSPQTYTVPAGVTQLQVQADGAAAGFGSNDSRGGSVSARIQVVPGEVLTVVVGSTGRVSDFQNQSAGGPGGYNGGGDGGSSSGGFSYGGQGGSGATDLRRIGGASSSNPLAGGSLVSTLNNRVLVAGGAAVGGTASGAGSMPSDGQAGTATSGGSGAAAGGGAGSLGQGGNGSQGGVGGGGGYYGGGGAYGGGAGGRGSDYVSAAVVAPGTAPVITLGPIAGNGVLRITPYYTLPAIASFTPSSGQAGTSVTLTGSSFSGATAVSFNGTNAPGFTVNGAGTQITVTVPAGASTGPIAVTTAGGTTTSSSSFTVGSTVAIASFTPASGPAGTSVTITGSEFTGTTAVAFNGTAASSFTVNSATSITAVVASGSTSGPISVTSPSGTAASSASFTVIPAPAIASFTPASGPVGTSVSISGSNFTGATAVAFNGTAAASFTVNSATSITATVAAGTTSGPISLTTPGGMATSAGSFTVVPAPAIAGFSPGSGPVNMNVVINGSSFTGATAVAFNGTSASFTVNSASQITAVVPSGATTGLLSVTTPGGTATSSSSFTVNPNPVVYSFSPGSGPVGTSVVITGDHFIGVQFVTFNTGSSMASFVVNSATQLTATVPAGATTGPIGVNTGGSTGFSPTAFVVTTPPSISSFTPASGPVGTSVSISGSNFTGATTVAFNGTAATFTVNSATSITATVPAGATSGSISVTTGGGTAASSGSFAVTVPAPAISSFTPASGPVGTSVSISGSNFTGATAVAFNGTTASFTLNSATSITATVAAGTTNGAISVTTPGGIATSGSSFTVVSPPFVGGFAPSSGPVGMTITISGSDFTGATVVRFGTLSASFTVDSPGQIRAVVPNGAITAPISVTTPAGTGTSSLNFVVNPDPIVYSFTPASGPAGTTVVISGDHFINVQSVRFGTGANAASFLVNSPSQITATVPAGAVTGLIAVNTGGNTGFSSTSFVVTSPPAISSFTPASGPVGTSVSIMGSNFTGATAVAFNGTTAASFTLNSATSITATVAAGTTSGIISVTTPSGTATSNASFTVIPAPTIAGFTPGSGPVGTSVTITGSNFTGATAVAFNGTTASSFTVTSPTQIMAMVAAGTTSGTISVTTAGGTATSTGSFTVTIPNLTVSSGQTISGTYNNVTITGTGVAILGGALTVNGTLTVQSGGQLLTECQPITGPGSFTLQAGATLGICHAAGISLNDTTGAVRLSGTRSYSTDALYLYNGRVAQVTGAGLPAQVRELTVSTTGGNLTLTNSLAIGQVVRITTPDFNYGNLDLGGRVLTLRSSAAGTALLVNAGNGSVLANTGTCRMERFIDPSLNPGAGYRHFSSPVPDMTIGQLATTGFTPVLNQAYNTAATPTSVTPFPNVFGYDQSRLGTATNNLDAFSKGWVVPTAGTAMAQAHGYTVHLPASAVVTFSGTSFNQAHPGRFISPARGPQADAGWVLVGNPYPSPFDLSVPNSQSRINLDAANYIYESTSLYGGQYRAYVNGIGGNPLLAAGQGFFVRMSTPGQNAALGFARGGRVTTFATQPVFRRGTADARAQVELRLQANGLADVAHVYAEAGATPGVDPTFDAVKLANPSGLNLATTVGAEELAIDGRPALTSGTTVPLTVQVPAAGEVSFTATLANLPAGLTAYLTDAVTGSRQDLSTQPTYRFTATLAGSLTGRFALVFGPANGLLGSSAAATAVLGLYPNPARSQATLSLPAAEPARLVRVLDALGRSVQQQQVPARATTAVLDLRELPAGVYSVRCGAATAKLVVE